VFDIAENPALLSLPSRDYVAQRQPDRLDHAASPDILISCDPA
jgi:hypothetical protein